MNKAKGGRRKVKDEKRFVKNPKSILHSSNHKSLFLQAIE